MNIERWANVRFLEKSNVRFLEKNLILDSNAGRTLTYTYLPNM